MRLLIAGDLSLQSRAASLPWDESSLMLSFDCIRSITGNCDHSIVNLESPVTEGGSPIVKDGPSLKNNCSVFDVIHYCGFDTVTLANNHLMDYGEIGVIDTLNNCKKEELNTIGAGINLEEARIPQVFDDGDIRIGIISICEHESSIASENSAGAAPLDLVNLYYDIRELREKVDKVIIIIHGGREHYPLPTPRMKREYRLLVDFGADVIVNHHQHCFSGYEVYHGNPIFYGLGNFFFDNPRKRNDLWNIGLLLCLDLTKDKTDYQLIPFKQCDSLPIIEVLEPKEINDQIERMNTIIMDDSLLNDSFNKLVLSKKPLGPFLPYGNHYLRALYNRGFLPDFMSKYRKAYIKNSISCETHREVLLRYFDIKHGNDGD